MRTRQQTAEVLTTASEKEEEPEPKQRSFFECDQEMASGNPATSENTPTKLLRVSELKMLPALAQGKFRTSEPALLEVAKSAPAIWNQPVTVTRNLEVVDRYDIWDLAKRQKRETILCLVRDLTPDVALQLMLAAQCRRSSIHTYLRIQIAFTLAEKMRDKAKTNQRLGGQFKGLSKLTEADRVDCRRSAAKYAGVSPAQVTKVQQIDESAIDQVKSAVLSYLISIHAAWKLRKLSPENQSHELKKHLEARGNTRRAALRGRRSAKLTDGELA
jgi:hypothetical protein